MNIARNKRSHSFFIYFKALNIGCFVISLILIVLHASQKK